MLAHICQKYMRFYTNIRECRILAPKSRVIIQGNIATGSDIERCLTYIAVPPPGPKAWRSVEVVVYPQFWPLCGLLLP